MARIDGSIRYQSTANRMREARRDQELTELFGEGLVKRAHATNVAALEVSAESMDAVHDAADELLAHSGDIGLQRRIVAYLNPATRLLLCMWVMDLSLAASLAARAIREPMQVRG